MRVFFSAHKGRPGSISVGLASRMATPNWSHAKARLLFGTGFRKILVVVKHSAYEVSESDNQGNKPGGDTERTHTHVSHMFSLSPLFAGTRGSANGAARHH